MKRPKKRPRNWRDNSPEYWVGVAEGSAAACNPLEAVAQQFERLAALAKERELRAGDSLLRRGAGLGGRLAYSDAAARVRDLLEHG